MTSIEKLQLRRDRVLAEILPLQKELSAIESELREQQSRQWIAANAVTKGQVQRCEMDSCGGKYHNVFWQFVEWMRETNCPKTWCEWNGMIYSVAEAMRGKMTPGIGFTEHLQGEW